MFKISYEGKKNIVGKNIYILRKTRYPKMSQRQFAEKLQTMGMDVGKNRISDIESGKSFVTDIEVKIIATFFGVSSDYLLSMESKKKNVEFRKKLNGFGSLEIADMQDDDKDFDTFDDSE